MLVCAGILGRFESFVDFSLWCGGSRWVLMRRYVDYKERMDKEKRVGRAWAEEGERGKDDRCLREGRKGCVSLRGYGGCERCKEDGGRMGPEWRMDNRKKKKKQEEKGQKRKICPFFLLPPPTTRTLAQAQKAPAAPILIELPLVSCPLVHLLLFICHTVRLTRIHTHQHSCTEMLSFLLFLSACRKIAVLYMEGEEILFVLLQLPKNEDGGWAGVISSHCTTRKTKPCQNDGAIVES